MALQEIVDQWFADNPNATPQMVADAVKEAGGLDAHAGLADILGSRFGIGGSEVTEAYNRLTTPSGGALQQVATTGGSADTSGGSSTANNATTVANLYQSVLGRAPESQEVIDYWTRALGDVDAGDRGIFENAAAAELAARSNTGATTGTAGATTGTTGGGALQQATSADVGTTGAAATTAATTTPTSALDSWTAPNVDDVIRATGRGRYENVNTGETYLGGVGLAEARQDVVNDSKKQILADAYAAGDFTGVKDFLERTGTTGYDLVNMFGLTPEQQAKITADTGFSMNSKEATDYRGVKYDTSTLLNLANQLAQVTDAKDLSGGAYGENRGNIGFDYYEAARAVGRDINQAEQVLLDAARGLINQGVTDLSQLKQGDIKSDVSVRQVYDDDFNPTGRYVASWGDSDSNTFGSRELTPEEAARITRTNIDTGEGGSYEQLSLKDAVTGKGLLFGDKVVSSDPGFLTAGQTYTGPGVTNYSIVYDSTGKPHFRTTGESTSDLGSVSMLLTAASFVPGVAPFAMAANAAIQASQGNTIGALASLAGAGGYTNVATGLNAANAIQSGNTSALVGTLLANPTLNAAAAGTMLTDTVSLADVGHGANVVTNLQNDNIGGALTSAGALTGSSDLKVAGAGATIVTELEKDNPNFGAIINAVKTIDNVTSSTKVDKNVVTNLVNNVTSSLNAATGNKDTGSSVYVAAKNAGATDDEAIAAVNAVTGKTTETDLSKATDATGAKVTDTTATIDTEFGNLDKAIADAKDRAVQGTSFKDAYAAARDAYGPGQTFTWNGKLYTTDTRAENPTLAAASDKINAADTAINLSTGAGAGRGSYAGFDAAAAAENASKIQSIPTVTYSGPTFLGVPVGTPADALRTVERMGEVVKDFSTGLGSGFGGFLNQVGDLSHIVSASLSGGDTKNTLIAKDNLLSTLGSGISDYYKGLTSQQSKDGWDTIVKDVNNAPEYLKPIVALTSTLSNFGGFVNKLGGEVGEEVTPLLTGLGVGSKLLQLGTTGTMRTAGVVSTLGDMAESASGSYKDVENLLKDRTDMTDTEKHWASTQAAGGSMAATALFGYGANAALAKALISDVSTSVASKVLGPVALEYMTEYPESYVQKLNDRYAANGTITAQDLKDANTDASISALLGSKTSGTIAGTATVVGRVSNGFVGADASEDSAKGGVAIVRNAEGQTALIPAGDLKAGQEVDLKDTTQIDSAADLVNQFNFDSDRAADITQSVDSLVASKADRDTSADTEVMGVGNTSADIVAKLTGHAAADTKINLGTDTKADTATDTKADTATDTKADTKADTATDTKADTKADTATDAKADTATDTKADTATVTKTDTATDTKADTATDTKVDAATDTATDIKADTKADTATDTTTDIATDTGTDTDVVTDTAVTTPATEYIDDSTTIVDGKYVDIDTGAVLTPDEVAKRKEAAKKLALNTPVKKKSALMGGAPASSQNYPYKPTDIEETWLGGRFRNTGSEMAALAALFGNTPMQQESEALSALRRASGITDKKEQPDTDYFSYGKEVSPAETLSAYRNGGTVQNLATGGKIMSSPLMAAAGGDVPHKGSHYVQGAGGGQDDLIPAKLADGEYVFDAEIVAALGDGSNKEGAKKLDAMREAIRRHKRSGSTKTIPPKAKSPLAYLKESMK